MRTYAVIFLFLFVCTSSAFSAPLVCSKKSQISPARTKNLVQAIQEKYRAVTSLQATFSQYANIAALGSTQESSGLLAYQKPGLLRWEYKTPVTQIFVARDNRLSFYQPEQEQLIISKYEEKFSSDLPVRFIIGQGDLEREFVKQVACQDGERLIFEFTAPESIHEEAPRYVRLITEPQGAGVAFPATCEVEDGLGNVTTVTLSDILQNQPIAAERFVLKVPEGTDVIDHDKPTNQ